MNAQPEHQSKSGEIVSASNNANLQTESAPTTTSLASLPVLTRVSSTGATAAVNGRVLPLVYVKMPQNQTVRMSPSSGSGSVAVVNANTVLPVSRSANLIPALAPKISIAPSANATVGLSANQATFLPIRSSAQTSVTSSVVATSQASFVSVPKGQGSTVTLSNQQILAFQNQSVTQAISGQQAQFVTIQAPIVSKTQTSSGQGQFVTIRTPVLASGTSASGAALPTTQSQFVTIQAPLIQAGSGSSGGFVPISSVNTSTSSGKAPMTYQIIKSGTKPGEQHIVYPAVPLPSILPSSQSKVLFSTMSVVPKSSTVSGVTTSPVVVSTVTDPLSNVVSIVPTETSTAQLPKAAPGLGVSLLQPKIQTQSLLKESAQSGTSEQDALLSQVGSGLGKNSVLLPVGVPSSSGNTTPSQGFFNLTIANGHIRPSGCRSGEIVSGNSGPLGRNQIQSSEANGNSFTELTPKSLSGQNQVSSENGENQMGMNGIGTSDSLTSHDDKENNESENHNKKRKHFELNKCLQEAVDEIFSPKTGCSALLEDEPKELTRVTTPISLYCDEDDITLTKLSPTSEQPKPKYTITMEHPDDDIKIELVKNDTPCIVGSKSLDSTQSSVDGSDDSAQLLHTPISQKSVHPETKTPVCKVLPKPISTSNTKAGQSVMKSPLNMQSILMKPNLLKTTPKPRLTVKSSSILKPKQSLLKAEGLEFGSEPSLTTPKASDHGSKPSSPSTPGIPSQADDFDLEWKNGVGLLPGSDLKFRMNEFGWVEMVSDDDGEQEVKADKPQSSPESESMLIDEASMASNSSITSGETKPNIDTMEKGKKDGQKSASEDFYCCDICGVYGLASEFLNPRFCTQACSAAFTVKKAWQYKREQDLRALRLRRKKRRLEQQKLAREKAEQDETQGDTKVTAKKMKREESISDDGLDATNLEERTMSGSQSSHHSKTTSQSPNSGAHNKGVASSVNSSGEDNPSFESSENSKKQSRPSKASSNFTWCRYLETVKAKAAPAKLFKDAYPYIKNSFKVGMKLEGIDPEHPAYFCVLSVVEVKGYRIRLHFDGYPENHDFWVNADSPEIFQAGWCEKNLRRLTPPRGYSSSTFNWNTYLKQSKSTAAPRYLFSKSSASPVCPNGFRLGMKLEAVDRKNSSLICVASVADILDNRILVHFDSWDEMYDYWADPSSPYIHPVGWCTEQGHTLTPPNQYKNPESFSWETYLKETKSVAAPARAFKQRPPCGFRSGMRIEAVDKRVPHIIRVATVDDVSEHRIHIQFDGWSEDYSYWVDDDSPDIHPPGWCRETKHPLEPPITDDDLNTLAKCGIPGCKGEGHIKGPKYATHNSAQNCPYAPENLRREGTIPDRLSNKSDLVDGADDSPNKDVNKRTPGERIVAKTLGRPPKWKRLLQGDDDNEQKKRRISEEDEEADKEKHSLITAMQQKLQMELERSVLDPGYQIETGPGRPACWAKHSLPLQSSPIITNCSNPRMWKPEEVAKFVSSVTGLEEKGQIFCDEDVDGEALLLLTQQELVSNLGLKLGPAIKLYNSIVLLRQKCS